MARPRTRTVEDVKARLAADPRDQLYGIDEIAEVLGVSPRRVRAIREATRAGVTVSSGWVARKADVLKMAAPAATGKIDD